MGFKQIQQAGVLLQVFTYFTLKDLLLSTACVSKKFCELSVFQLRIHKSNVEGARLPTLSKELLVEIIILARKLTFRENLVELPPDLTRAVIQANSLHILASPQHMGHMMRINAAMFTHWHAMPNDPTRGIYEMLSDLLLMHPDDKEIHDLCVRNGKYWGTSRVQDNFICLFDRPDGTILVSSDYQHVYLVLGQAQTVGDIANLGCRNGEFYRKPPYPAARMHSRLGGAQVATTLLNWEDWISFDGMLSPYCMATPNMLRNALKAYAKAYDEGRIISKLPLIEPEVKTATALSEEDLAALATAVRDDLAAILSRPPAPEMYASWFFERYGYTEDSNVGHFMCARTGGGFDGDYFPLHTAALEPTPVEIMRNFREVAENRNMRPSAIVVDSEQCVAPLKHILRPASIAVSYSPPPSAEEQSILSITKPQNKLHHFKSTPPTCAHCNVRHREDGTPLLACSACKGAFYCCREHQKKHWKTHKPLCELNREIQAMV